MAKLGIDLGTSNSAAALVFNADNKNSVTVEPVEGPLFKADQVFPSYVAFNKKGEWTEAGLPARDAFIYRQSELVVRHFKRLIGRPYDYVADKISRGHRGFLEFEGRIKRADDGLCLVIVGEKDTSRDISVAEIASHLLRKIFKDTQIQLQKWGETLEAVTITLPAGFDDSQRQATAEAAKMAGLSGVEISVIEEPTAAAIAKGLSGVEGNIMVIDVGAGTTDVVIGRMEKTQGGIKLVLGVQAGDDELGGIDMDSMILDSCAENDPKPPKLVDILPHLETNDRLRLMAKIEEAKINASTDGYGVVSTALSTTPPKRVHIPITEEQLASIVSPIINGYSEDNYTKGIKCVVERALLDLAGGKKSAIPQAIQQIEHLILVGGPCRMKCLRDMLKEVFQNNSKILTQIENTDAEDPFFLEGVARGAALCQVEGVDATDTVAHDVMILHHLGSTHVVARGTPFRREEGISRTVTIPVRQGSNMLSVLSQKESQPKRQWSLRKHIVNVPEEGELELTMTWDESGAEAEKTRIMGCGLPGTIGLSTTKSVATLGSDLERDLKGYLEIARGLREHLQYVRKPLLHWIMPQVGTAQKAEQWVDEWLYVPDSELAKCEAINPAKQSRITDSDIELALASGKFEMRDHLLKERGLLSDKLIELIDKVFLVVFSPADVQELNIEVMRLLDLGHNCPACSSFSQQLKGWFERLEADYTSTAFAAAVATSLAALADCLYDQRVITEEDFFQIRNVCWRFTA